MGIIWKSAMPLLTTLAALVIIVHSAEEDLEAEYRHDLRPRILDTGTPSYDQPWRAIEADPLVQEPRNTENWNNESPDEPPKRRRPGRKRKRRPQTSSAEDLEPQDRIVYPDEPPRPYFEVDFENIHKTTEMPKRRRKIPENRPIRWTDDVVEIERPVRRRGQRRKRPSLEAWPELNEFKNIEPASEAKAKTETLDQVNIDDIRVEIPQAEFVQMNENIQEKPEQKPSKLKLELKQLATDVIIPLPVDDSDGILAPQRVHAAEDKSLSEFSSEFFMTEPRPTKRSNSLNKLEHQNNNKSEINEGFAKAQDSYLMDPLTLKDILKRSNGTSLSEILQQHNLSLTDLLHGKQHAVSIFKSRDSIEVQNRNPTETRNELDTRQELQDKDRSEEQTLINLETKYEPASDLTPETQTEDGKKDEDPVTTTMKPVEKTPKISTRRRFPQGVRKKLRMRPMMNDTYKGQLSRDLVTLNSRKYSHYRRNMTKSKEWRDVLPAMMQNNRPGEKNPTVKVETTTMAIIPEETTITFEVAFNNISSEEINLQDDLNIKLDDIDMETTEAATIPTEEIITETPKPITEKPMVVPMIRQSVNSSGLRRQAFNNRLKRKRLKHKNATTEPPQDDIIKHLFGLGTLVSSSEFIARTEDTKSVENDDNDLTTLEDFITTESTHMTENGAFKSRTTVSIAETPIPISSTTEETAKIEIEEILNDTRTSAKLSKILMERNMTLSELVEHRERGSSHVHLADIFHNASREPNPPEPFLSKSLLEPISKETYPLRALLDANLHDPNARTTTDEPGMISNVNIPVVMDFRNNVNENAENMGIMSLFHNFTKLANTTILTDSEGKAYKTSIEPVNVTNVNNVNNASEPTRESRVLSEGHDIVDDIVSWNEIFSLMGRNHNNDTPSNSIEGLSLQPFKKIRLDEDADGDGLIVLEDLQHLKDFENNIASDSDEKIEVNGYDNKEDSHKAGILDTIPAQTKSVTVATASIAGLAMVLFLLTYATFKWRQQRSVIRKKRSFADERIPTPVFENRKGHKHNSSTRSISPMLQTSNIYTLNTLDSQNGKDSPDYMWDTLRKPFQ
ncbi:titin [Helicoverpa armigera]|uniref:titin n=1 Tax=Helicoverpa armigera TaxID=29058 RepID=UPI0030835302